MRPGELLAIMGASGAGKSTMLNALTFRNLSGLDVQGEIKANGVPITPTMVTSLSAYIQQDDMFIGILTVREQLEFQARLRVGWVFAPLGTHRTTFCATFPKSKIYILQ